MQLRRLLLATAGFIVATIGFDKLLTSLADPLPPPAAGRTDTVTVDGLEVNVLEAGNSDGRDIVLVHGFYLGAAAREFTALGNALTEQYRVHFVDLPGFGRSDRQSRLYDTDRYSEAITAVIEARTDDPIVIASGQAYAAALDASDQSSATQLVAIGPRTSRTRPRPFLAALLETPILGTALHLVMNSRPLLASHLARTLELPRHLVKGDFLSYTWRSAHQSGSHASVAAWFGGELDVIESLVELAGEASVEQAFVIGELAGHPTVEQVRDAANAAEATVSVVSDTGACPHLEAPDAVARHLRTSEGLLHA